MLRLGAEVEAVPWRTSVQGLLDRHAVMNHQAIFIYVYHLTEHLTEMHQGTA